MLPTDSRLTDTAPPSAGLFRKYVEMMRAWFPLSLFFVGMGFNLRAEQVPIANAGFESPALSEGEFSDNIAGGWIVVETDGPRQAGTYNPVPADWATEAPLGAGVCYLRRGAMFQVLSVPLIAGAQYQLSCYVGDSQIAPVGSSVIQLRVGQTRLNFIPSPPAGQFVRMSSSVFTLPPGQGLDHAEIWIIKNDESAATAFFLDDLSLVPIPSSRCPYDVTGNLLVDLGDLAVLLAHFGKSGGATQANGELDGDGDVDLDDLSLLLAHFGATC